MVEGAVCKVEEVEEGKAEGPFTEEEMSRRLGPLWASARRFGLQQAAGTRPIDDFSLFGHNDSSGGEEKVDLGGVDAIVGLSLEWRRVTGADYDDSFVHEDFRGKKVG